MAPMADADCCSRSRRRFAVACSVLSRFVRAEAAAAAGRVAAAGAPDARSEAQAAAAQAASSTMLLMPGADVDAAREEAAAAPTVPAQLTIMYGGSVLVFDDVPAGRAAEVMRAAVARQDDLQVARKASLQRLMQKRRERIAARAPYASARPVVVAPKEGREEGGDTSSWLELGIPRGCAC